MISSKELIKLIKNKEVEYIVVDFFPSERKPLFYDIRMKTGDKYFSKLNMEKILEGEVDSIMQKLFAEFAFNYKKNKLEPKIILAKETRTEEISNTENSLNISIEDFLKKCEEVILKDFNGLEKVHLFFDLEIPCVEISRSENGYSKTLVIDFLDNKIKLTIRSSFDSLVVESLAFQDSKIDFNEFWRKIVFNFLINYELHDADDSFFKN